MNTLTPKPSIEEIIARQLDGAPLGEEERHELHAWLRASETNRRTYLRAYEAWGRERLSETRFDTEEALDRLKARIAAADPAAAAPADDTAATTRSRTPARRIGIAALLAAACLAAAVGVDYWLRADSASDIETFIRQTEKPVYTQKEVRLTLSEQKTLLLETQNTSIRYDSTAIRINEAEKTISKKEAAAFNQLIVPYGKQSRLTLADGTRVWVNAGSRLIYPVVFDSRRRELFVEGEVYMEVAHDAARPFTVHTDKMDVSVLGTRFYVSSYGRDRTQEVVLLSGSVCVAPTGKPDRGLRIEPGQQAVLDASDDLAVRRVDPQSRIGWIHGYLPFEKERLGYILERLSRHYNRRIECAPAAAELTLSGKLELKDDLADVLHVLSATAPIRIQPADSGAFRIACQPTPNPLTPKPM